LKQLKEESDQKTADYRTSAAALSEYRDFLGTTYVPVARAVLVFLAVVCIVVAIARRAGSRAPSFVAAACCLVLLVVVSGVSMSLGQRDAELPKDTQMARLDESKLPAADKLAKSPGTWKCCTKELWKGRRLAWRAAPARAWVAA